MDNRRALVAMLVAFGLACCTPVVVIPESRVGIRERRTDADQGLALAYEATVCSVTIRDESGALHDREIRSRTESRTVDMTRELPVDLWELENSGRPSTLLTVIAMPPGRYTMVEYSTVDGWDRVPSKESQLLRHTDCSGGRERHVIRAPFSIHRDTVTLFRMPKGNVDFGELDSFSLAYADPYARGRLTTWGPAIERQRKAVRARLVESRREVRNGYEVYRNCDGKTAVVRRTGTPLPWRDHPYDEAAAEAFRQANHGDGPTRPMQAWGSGLGTGCVDPIAQVIFTDQASELEPGVTAIGEWLARENLMGEYDIIVSPMPVEL